MSIARTPRWLILLAVVLAARAITFGNPILHVDEEFYFVTARAMLDGAVPFVDVWDRKPIGLFLIYAPAAALGYPAGIWAYQALALACLVATAIVAARLADRAGWQRGALAAGVAVILWPNLIDGQGGQAPVFYNLLMIAAAALIVRGEHEASAGRRFVQGLAAMALVGLALQVKYAAVFEGLFFGLWLLWREWRAERGIARVALAAVPLAGVAFAPTLIAWAVYAGQGQGDAWLYANFLSILDRNPDRALEQFANLAAIMSGAPQLSVRKRPSVAILTTGDELVQPGHELAPGQIPDSNGAMLAAMLASEPVDIGSPLHMRDDRMMISRVLKDLARRHDVIVTVGGASVGDHDHVRGALEDAGGHVDFWKIAMKPGKPLIAGMIGDARLVRGEEIHGAEIARQIGRRHEIAERDHLGRIGDGESVTHARP